MYIIQNAREMRQDPKSVLSNAL